MQLLSKIWRSLTEPHPSVQVTEARHKSRFLASLLVLMMPLGLGIIIVSGYLSYSTEFIRDNDFLSILAGSLFWFVAYRWARRGRYRQATILAVGVGSLAIFLGSVLDTDGGMGELSFLVFPILLASLILSVRGTALLVLASLAASLLAPLINPAASIREVLVGPVTYLLVGFILILIANRYRDLLEGARRAELAEHERRYRTLLEDGYGGLMVVVDGQIIDADEGFGRLFGHEPGQAVGMPVADLVIPEYRQQIAAGLNGAGVASLEVIAQHKDGSTFFLEMIPSHQEYQGRLANVIAVRNITEQVRFRDAYGQQAAELARSRVVVTSLYKISSQISTSYDPDAVLETLGTELKRLELNCAVALLEDEGQTSDLVYLSLGRDLLSKGEQLLGISLMHYRVSHSEWLPEMRQVFEQKEPVFVPDFLDFVCHFFPESLENLVRSSFGLAQITAKTVAFYLPLQVRGQVLGSLAIWGTDLHQDDQPTFMVFANQVANAYENARLHRGEKRQAEEMARSNALVKALSRVSQKVISTLEPQEVFETLGDELRTLGLGCAYTSVSRDRETAVLEFLSLDSKVVSKIEKIAGLKLSGYRMTQSTFSPEARLAVEGGQPVFLPSVSEAIAPLFGQLGKSVFKQGLKMARIQADTPGIYLPMELEDGSIGFLTVWGSSIRESDLNAFRVFANQVVSSLQNSRLYQAERLQASEIERSHAIVMALSNVATKIGTTKEPNVILSTLGQELKTIGLDCLVVLIDPDTDIGYVRFHSMDQGLMRRAEKLLGTHFGGARARLEEWPEAMRPVVHEGRSVFFKNFAQVVAGFIPFPNIVAMKSLEVVGVGPEVPGTFLPLAVEQQVIGCLSIWGEDLRARDLATYNVFAGQVASALENARLYEVEQKQAGELERSNALITALSRVSAQVASSADSREIFNKLGQELKKLDLQCAIALNQEGGEAFQVAYISLAGEILNAIQKISKQNFLAYSAHRKRWSAEEIQVLEQQQPVFIEEFTEFAGNFFPRRLRRAARKVLRLAALTERTSGLLLPLVVDQTTLGAITVWGETVEEIDLAAYQIFASELAALLENARLHEAAHRQAAELERSSAVVNALSNVSARISATKGPDEILVTLGEETKRLGLDCLVLLLEPDRQAAYIHYLSYGPEILQQVEQLTGVRLADYRIPRSLWTPVVFQVFDHCQPVYLADFAEAVLPYFPRVARPILHRGLEFLGVSGQTCAFYLPLDRGGEAFGSVTVWGDVLREADMPAYTVFASQVSNAFEHARLFNQAQDEIVQRREIQNDLERSREEFQGLFENAHDAILIIDAESGQVLDVNQSACEIYGFSKAEFISMDLADITVDDQHWKQHLARTLDSGRFHHFEASQYRKDGQLMELEIKASLVDYLGRKAVQSIHRDVTARNQYERKLVYDALHDSLTDLPNRELFVDRLGHAIGRLKRFPEAQFAVLYIDLDQFKKINDSLGHLVGDRFLIAIGQRLQSATRGTDAVARLSGDEFAILLEDIASPHTAIEFAQRLLTILTEPVKLDDHDLVVTASMGIVISSLEYQTPEEYLRDADTAMYRAKALGKGRHAVFDASMHASVLRKLSLEGRLRRAIQAEELFLQYQPIMSLSSGKRLGYEALARWQTANDGLVPPQEFIPVAEESGLIHVIGRWVLREACAQFATWLKHYPQLKSQRISVNVSGIQLLQANFPEIVEETLQETGLPPENLSMEITESALITETLAVDKALQQLHELGIRIHLDDFGTGYSSLSFLARFPIEAIKIDRRFVLDIHHKHNTGLVRSMISLGQDLGLKVIAEGIETAQQVEALRQLGCERGQGHFYARPMDAEEVW